MYSTMAGTGCSVAPSGSHSRAARRGLQTGDVIRSVNGKKVGSVDEVREGLREARESGRKAALLQVDRQGQITFIPVPVRRG